MFGLVKVAERVWRTEQNNYLRLLPEAIGVRLRGRSRRLERVLTDFGIEHSFQHAAARVLEHYGFEMNVSAVRNATLHHAGRAEQILKKEYQQPFRVLPEVAERYVVAETDGSMLCTVAPGPRTGKKPREWKEIRLAAARGLDKTDTFYAATFGEVDEVGRRWGHCALRAGRGLNSQVHALGDGAEWIRLQTREVFGQQATFLCDYYHVSEYLAEAAPTCRAQAPERWRRTQQDRLKRGALTKVIDALAEHLEPPDTPEEPGTSEQRTSLFKEPDRLLGLSPCLAAGTTDRIGFDRIWAQARVAGSPKERGCLANQQCRVARKPPRPARQSPVAGPVELMHLLLTMPL